MAFYIRPPRIRYSILFFISGVCLLMYVNMFPVTKSEHKENTSHKSLLLVNSSFVNGFYEKRKSWNTSKLGSLLFKNEDFPELSEQNANKKYVMLVWKRWEFLQKRHLYYFGSTRHDPLDECSVKNCIFSGNDSLLNTADAVIVHLHSALIPNTKYRNPDQKWIFLDDESPKNSFAMAKKKPTLSELANVFNWSMTYRSDADIPVPYGRIIALKTPIPNTQPISEIVPNWKIKRRDVLAAILLSNCGVNYRQSVIQDLKKMLGIHVYGKCGDKEFKNSCPGHFRADCEAMKQYLFYIVLENSKCKEYITEKLFNHAYSRGSIPIIQGPSIKDCERLLPPNSYLHLDNYATIRDLVKDIKDITENNEKLASFHMWRYNFEVRNEHGFFGSKSYHLCRLCEAMNYNDKTKSAYSEEDLKRFLDSTTLCRN